MNQQDMLVIIGDQQVAIYQLKTQIQILQRQHVELSAENQKLKTEKGEQEAQTHGSEK